MNARRWACRLACAVVVVSAPAVALPPHAPNDQYGPFDSGTPAIIDRKTKLRWTRTPSAPIAFNDAVTFCKAPSRLPTLKELLTLVDELPHSEYSVGGNVQKMIDPDAFPATPTDAAYWTSSLDGGSRRYTVDFADGSVESENPTVQLYARCVQFDATIK